SWLGWHDHATLVTAAHLFLTTLRLTDPKAAGQDRRCTPFSANSNAHLPVGSVPAHYATTPSPPNKVLLVVCL
ncbi:MAG: hypothetical protein EOP24_33755, partial [Hyphomicrobiales bacterium]